MQHLVGKKQEGKTTLAPIGHIVIKAAIEVTLDEQGNFVRANKIDEEVLIPCTEESAGRSGSKAIERPHPLCDQICYLITQYYQNNLKKWIKSEYSCRELEIVYKYISSKTLIHDIENSGITVNEKDNVIWRIEGLGENSGSVCENEKIQKLHTTHLLSQKKKEAGSICMITGERDVSLTANNPKKIMNIAANAKLISANDKVNYTYRGRFLDGTEACTISYVASQKAHTALTWILSTYGIGLLGSRTKCVAWNPNGKEVKRLDIPIPIFNDEKEISITPEGYKRLLQQEITGMKTELSNKENVVIAMFSAPTDGRLSVIYYNELPGDFFLKRMGKWDEETLFPNRKNQVSVPYLQTYIKCAYGTYRKEKNSGGYAIDSKDSAFCGQQLQQLIACKVDGRSFPRNIMLKLVENASKLYLYTDDAQTKRILLHTTCSAIRKYHIDKFKEDISMSLEREKRDRSYQYGRLLAVLEKIEDDTYERDEKRETNAIRMQSMYVQKPLHTFKQVIEKLKQAYYRKLSEAQKMYYEKLIEEITTVISECEAENPNKSLDEMYIIGYYLQKQDLYSKKKSDNEIK